MERGGKGEREGGLERRVRKVRAKESKEGPSSPFYSKLGYQVTVGRSIPGYSQITVGVESCQNSRSLGHCLHHSHRIMELGFYDVRCLSLGTWLIFLSLVMFSTGSPEQASFNQDRLAAFHGPTHDDFDTSSEDI